MTTELARQKGIPPSGYAGHVNRVLCQHARQRSRRRLWLGAGIATAVTVAALILGMLTN